MATSKKKVLHQGRSKQKTPSPVEELDQKIMALQARVCQVEDYMREGFPYRDALRPRMELQVKGTVREVFGEQSTEFQRFKDHLLRSTNDADISKTVLILQNLVMALHHQKMRLLGLTPPAAPGPDSTRVPQVSPSTQAQRPAAPPVTATALPAQPATTQSVIAAPVAVQRPSLVPSARPVMPGHAPAESGTARPQTARSPDMLSRLRKIGDSFHAVARQLRLRGEYRATLEVNDQQDVQDLFYALLRYEFNDVATEDWQPSYPGVPSQMTFFLEGGRIAVIAKKTQAGWGAKEMTEELAADAQRHAKHPGRAMLFCFVYDPEGRVGNPRGLETELTRKRGAIETYLLISPK